jgi:hypothetical protein
LLGLGLGLALGLGVGVIGEGRVRSGAGDQHHALRCGIWGRTASEWPCRSAVESDAGRGSVECVRVDRLGRGVGCALRHG